MVKSSSRGFMMRILEARDGFIKFEVDKKLSVSSFVEVSGFDKKYIAQIIKVQNLDDIFLAFAKILFLYDGSLRSYDKSLPNKDATIKVFDFETLSQVIENSTPVNIGKFIDGRIDIILDKTCFNKKTLISAESSDFQNIIISNLKQELNKTSKVFVIDMQGGLDAQKFVAGKDFRLPLNTESLNFLYEDCLNDATADSKSLIKDIFKDLSEYSKTVPFLPFGTLKAIVDDMVNNSHIFKLLVLKNKLTKFDQMGYFAINSSETENLYKILKLNEAYIDLSKLDAIFQNRFLELIYKNLVDDSYVIVIASNNISKNNLKTILTQKNIASTFVTHPRFKYINEIKGMFRNFIIEPSFINNEVFKTYNTFLSTISKNNYLIVGEGTKYLPLVSVLEKNPDTSKIDSIKNEEPSENDEILEEIVNLETDESSQVTTYEVEIEKDEQTEAIEKKSEELIEKLSENMETMPQDEISLFNENEDENFDAKSNEEDGKLSENDNEDTNEKQEINEETIEASPENLQEEEDDDEVIDSVSDINEDSEIIIEEEEEEENFQENFHTNVENTQTIEVCDEILEMTDDVELIDDLDIEENINDNETSIEEDNSIIEQIEENEVIIEEIIEEESSKILKESTEEIEEEIVATETAESDTIIQEQDVITLDNDEDLGEIEEVFELDDAELNETDIIVEIDDIDENLDKEIIEDVDKVFTTIKEDALSDNDLDLIDELNSENSGEGGFEYLTELPESSEEELDFSEPIEEINETSAIEEEKDVLETKKSITPNVPIYDAEIPQEDTVHSDQFEQGDTVSHAKYGVGVVEKMIKYGNKTLYSINFDNVGRRLLDPTLTEIKKN